MTEEIKKLIEEEAERYADSKGIYNQHGEALLKMGFKKGANFILSKWQEAERWRKVEEDPKWEGKEFTLITKKIGEYGTIYNIFPIRYEKSILFMKDLADEWKPIS